MTKKTENFLNEKVTIRITPPNESEEDNGMFVSVGSYNAYIKYNEDVEVPRFVAEMLKDRQLAIKDMKRNASKLRSKE